MFNYHISSTSINICLVSEKAHNIRPTQVTYNYLILSECNLLSEIGKKWCPKGRFAVD